MNLREWLRLNNVGQAEFARHIGVTQGPISKFIAGHVLPSLETAVLIESATGGAVKPASWVRSVASKAEAA
jgi:DNA-binding transcriptional regulator YdaS (Cro superfamily)